MFQSFDPDPGSSPGQAGLNQLTQYAAKALAHDSKGNVTGFGTDTFGYSSENLMTSATVSGTATTLTYDPLLRLYQTTSGATTSRFAYDGLDAIAEYNSGGTLQRRFVFDPTGVTGQPVVWYEGTGTAATARRYLSADERGSIVSVSDSAGAVLAVNSYDEYGLPSFGALANQRFGYTGQMWIASAQLWYYKARVYHPTLGRFLQPDPIGYGRLPNLYAYVMNDPVNWIDPDGEVAWFAVGFAVGAGVSIGAQVIQGMSQGQSFGQALANVNLGQVALEGALGSVGGGLASATLLGKVTLRARGFAMTAKLTPQQRVATGVLTGVAATPTLVVKGISPAPNRFCCLSTSIFLPNVPPPVPAPGTAPYLVSHAIPLNLVVDENGNVIGYIDENGNFVPFVVPEDETTTASD